MPRSPDAPAAEGASERPAKARRIRLACLRCQTRKIKCDGSIPKCSSCHRAGVECVDGKKTYQEGGISRSEAAVLHDQIQRLEDALRSRCPDVNIEEVIHGENTAITPRPRNDASKNSRFATVQSSIQQPQSFNSNNLVDNNSGTASNPPLRRNQPAPATPASMSESAGATISTMLPQNEVAHEIGLIPLSTGVSKYIGPSSGFSFARLLFTQAGRMQPRTDKNISSPSHESPSTIKSRSMFMIEPTAIPSSVDQAVQLSKIYFEHVHVIYPFLHEPSHYRLINQVYRDPAQLPAQALFQVTMVLAISATILSKRLRIPFTGEGLCASAMEHVESIDFQSSTQGVQCLLLIAMFTLHSPYLTVNPWYINYQCLAAVLDLGLQRDVPVSPSVSAFEREMRTRIFWVIYSIDRILATTLGRPIGLRDEACDLRLPSGLEDCEFDLDSANLRPQQHPTPKPESMSCSMILFKVAQLNSEIKYILHSVTRSVPKYTYPQIPDIETWQLDLYKRLQTVFSEIPAFTSANTRLTKLCQIRWHEVVMLLFRPTPRIRIPTKESLLQCHKSAEATIILWRELYDSDGMSYSWITIHSICLSAITMLYCIWTVPELASSTKIDILTSTMRASSNILSAAAEYWVEARRSRNSLDDLTAATIRWLLDLPTNQSPRSRSGTQTSSLQVTPPMDHQQYLGNIDELPPFDFPPIDTYINGEDLAVFVGAPDPFSTDLALTMEGMFSEYQPLFDFNPQQDFGTAF